ncbi:LemA protein [Halpernia humi]|uniref:LemA protein n=1 Tax=Halpernia humi TaxID=493375 RepID=A0A1H6AKT6_9FLAO|nr:LemA family protein [Halpernia humi]SEG48356.1 LemA protein [Halpernia humi]
MKNKGCMSAGTIGIVLLVIAAIAVFWGFGAYKGLVTGNNDVQKNWSNVETVYQKRANLIPNLENTIKSYTKYEQGTLTSVIEARSKATSVNIDASNLTEADMAKFQAAQGELTGSLSRLMAVVESYPNLKADQQYINFQREYTAIENSIRMETVNYNNAVETFNNKVETPPTSFLVMLFPKFKSKPFFKAAAGTEKAPEVFK